MVGGSFLLLSIDDLNRLTNLYTAARSFSELVSMCKRRRYVPSIFSSSGTAKAEKAQLADAVEACGCKVYRGTETAHITSRWDVPVVTRISLN